MGTVVMYGSVSVDGFVADENDQPGPLFDWLSDGDVPLDESGELLVSQTSYDYIRPYWDQIGVTLVGRHVFDLTDGWDGKPPSGIDPRGAPCPMVLASAARAQANAVCRPVAPDGIPRRCCGRVPTQAGGGQLGLHRGLGGARPARSARGRRGRAGSATTSARRCRG